MQHTAHNTHTAVERILSSVAYILDAHEYERLGEVFAPDINFVNPGQLTATGLEDVIAAFAAFPAPALSHHITNVIVDLAETGRAECVSKALALRPGGVITAAIYRDTVTLTDGGWRVTRRHISPLG